MADFDTFFDELEAKVAQSDREFNLTAICRKLTAIRTAKDEHSLGIRNTVMAIILRYAMINGWSWEAKGSWPYYTKQTGNVATVPPEKLPPDLIAYLACYLGDDEDEEEEETPKPAKRKA